MKLNKNISNDVFGNSINMHRVGLCRMLCNHKSWLASFTYDVYQYFRAIMMEFYFRGIYFMRLYFSQFMTLQILCV